MTQRLEEISGTYGSGRTPCTVFCLDDRHGNTWYAVEGSVNVNLTPDNVADGVDVETLCDIDMFTWPDGISGLEELERAVAA